MVEIMKRGTRKERMIGRPIDEKCYDHDDYMLYAIRDRQETISRTAAFIDGLIEDGYPIDSIAFTGMSGALIAPAVADMLDLPIILVRKPHDASHSYHTVEGYLKTQCYVVVDDFVASGKTVRYITTKIEEWVDRDGWKADNLDIPLCVGVVMYNHIMEGYGSAALHIRHIPERLLWKKG